MQDKFLVNTRPLFVLGVPRSGTTFLQQVLNTHPSVFLTDELRFVSWLVTETRKLRGGYETHGDPYPFHHGAAFADYLVDNAGRLVAPFYAQFSRKAGKSTIKYWGDKYPHYEQVLPIMTRMFPRACYIMIHRDLRDTACSVAAGHEWTIERSMKYACRIYGDYISRLDELTESGKLESGCVSHTEHSTLSHSSTRDEALRLFEWLGLETDDETLDRAGQLATVQSHSQRRPGSNPRRFEISESEGRWKKLNASQQQMMHDALDGIRAEFARGKELCRQTATSSASPQEDR
jgi:hypothetical protein